MKGEGFSAFLPYNLSFVASLLILHLHVFRQQLSDVRPKPSDVRPKPSDAHQKVSDYIYHSRIPCFHYILICERCLSLVQSLVAGSPLRPYIFSHQYNNLWSAGQIIRWHRESEWLLLQTPTGRRQVVRG